MTKAARAKVTSVSAKQRALLLLALAVGCSVHREALPAGSDSDSGGMSTGGQVAGTAGKASAAGSSASGSMSGGNATSAGGPGSAGEGASSGADDAAPTCTDSIRNGDEVDVDCGGTCGECPVMPCSDWVLSPSPDEVLAKESLVGWYRFQDAESLGLDLSAAGNDALSYEVVTQGDDAEHGCVAVFNGKASITLPAVTKTNLTFSLWIRAESAGVGVATGQWFEGSGLLDGEQPGVVNDLGLTLLGNRAAFGIGKPDQTLRAGPALDDNVWHQIVVTRDDTSGEIALFIDGDEHARGGAAVGERSSLQRLIMGKNQLQARLADVRIYDRVFTKAEIVELYQGK